MNNGDCEVKFIKTKLQLADIFTKPLPKERFFFFRNELGILDSKSFLKLFYNCYSLFVKTNRGRIDWFLCVFL